MAFEVEFSKRLDLFGAEIFAALNDKKVALEAQGKKLYNLSVGTPDFEPMPHIKQALCDAAMVSENWKYSLRDLPELLDTVCAYYKRRFDVDGITPDQIMSFNGSQDGMGHMGLALLNDGDVVLLPDPCYPVFITGVKLGGGVPYYYHLTKEHNFLPNVKEIPDDVADKAKIMIVSLPANPVGSVGSPELYQEIVDFCNAHKILLIHDNAYSDIIFDGAVGHSIFNIPGAETCAVEFFSLSKSFNVTARASAFGGPPRCDCRMQEAAHPDRFRQVHPGAESRHCRYDRPAGAHQGPVCRIPAPPRRPVRGLPLHRLGCAGQPRLHVRLGTGPAGARHQHGVLHGND